MQKQKVASAFFLAVGIYGLVFSRAIPLGRWNEPGPGVFPLALSALLCLWGFLGLILVRKGVKQDTGVTWREILGAGGLPLRIAVLTAAFIPLMGVAGYLAASILYLFALLLWVSRYPWRTSLIYSVLLGAVSWYLFARFLGIELPKMGLWFF
jgi:hypothetical protein